MKMIVLLTLLAVLGLGGVLISSKKSFADTDELVIQSNISLSNKTVEIEEEHNENHNNNHNEHTHKESKKLQKSTDYFKSTEVKRKH